MQSFRNQCLVLFVAFCIPSSLEAAVVFNEVAWMGTTNSANDEWIELYNSGNSPESLEGWMISDGDGLDVALTGTLAAGQFAVLERTDDDSAPGTAFLLYVGALSNVGATLTLRNENGSLIDQVAGGENWEEIGGDNTTKETAQLTTSGWVTGAATPGNQNVTSAAVTVVESESDGETSKSSSIKNKKISTTKQLQLSDGELALTLRAPSIAYVGQPIDFEIEPRGLGYNLRRSVQYAWNFGDLAVGTGKAPQHAYQYPGEYVVMVEGVVARHDTLFRHEITVLPLNFSLSRNRVGDVQIHNDAKYEVDVSGFTVVGKKELQLPDNTMLLPGATLTVSAEHLGDSKQLIVSLKNPAAKILAYHSPWPPVVVSPPAVAAVLAEPASTSELVTYVDAPLIIPDEIAIIPQVQVETVAGATFATSTPPALPRLLSVTTTSSNQPQTNTLPYVGLAALVMMGVGGVFLRKIHF